MYFPNCGERAAANFQQHVQEGGQQKFDHLRDRLWRW